MELLLLLSAFLTALTGAITGVRAPDAPVQHVAGIAAAGRNVVAVAKVVAAPVLRIAAERPSFTDAYRAEAPTRAVPLYADRLRE